MQKNYCSFSIRIPPHIELEITRRARLNRRSRNAEIIVMLESELAHYEDQVKTTLKEHEQRLTQRQEQQPSEVE